MKLIGMAFLAAFFLTAAQAWAAPDISDLPPHPRLWIGGLPTAAGHIDPDTLMERAETHPEQFDLLRSATSIEGRALLATLTGDSAMLAELVDTLKTVETHGTRLAFHALAFDWIAAVISDEDRAAIARNLGDLAEASYEGWTNVYHNINIGRSTGAAVAALAIAGHDPRAQEIFDATYPRFVEFMNITGDGLAPTEENLHGRAAWGGGWPEAHDYDRHGSRYALIYFLALRSATGEDVLTGSRFWQDKPLFHIYVVLPNGRNIVPFHDDDHPFLLQHEREVMLVLSREYEDPYARWYVNHVNDTPVTGSAAWEFLFDEPDIPERDFTSLPHAHYIPGTGTVYARSGWGLNDTYVAFSSADWFTYHQNNSQNEFVIYRNAPLAVKDGVYHGSVWDDFINYTIRTVSHNCITVFDPDETFMGPWSQEAANDGGQMIQQWTGDPHTLEMWRAQADRTDRPRRDIVDWIGFETNDVYTYAAAEAGRAYSEGKVPFFSRQLLFIYPHWILVFDRVEAGDPTFRKTFHLHAPEEMDVSGTSAVITTHEAKHTTIPGRLFVESLLPHGATVERIDGLAIVEGKSWAMREPYNDQLLCPHHLNITAPEETVSFFLTAMYATDADVDQAPAARIVEETDDSVTVSLDEGAWVVRFNKTGEVAWEMVE